MAISIGGSSHANNSHAGEQAGRGPKRQRYEICEQCDEEFDTTEDSDEECVWHDGTAARSS
jgi:hypothetical protein